ncbi:MAG: putative transporter, permease protein [Eubacterium sp.]|jgi:ABC-2 type transport system permease protein|nr:putative transporter, permease protein [Eubacterium sp.]
MNNTILLIKAQLINSSGINKLLKSSTKGEKVKAGLFGGMVLFVIFIIFVQMSMYAWVSSGFLAEKDALDVLIIAGTAISILICLFMSIYKAPGYLFAFKDFDMLMSLPVSKGAVLVSKLFMIVVTNTGLSVLLGFPYLMVYGIKTSSGIAYYLAAFFMLIFTSLIPVTVGALLSLLLGRLSAKARRTNLLLIIGSFVLLVLFMGGMLSLNSLTAANIENLVNFVGSVKAIYYPFGLITAALKHMDILSMVIFAVISIMVFAAFIGLFARSFKGINSKMQEKYKASDYKLTELQVQTSSMALFKKELGFYFSSYIYVINTGFGAIMMLLATVLLIYNRPKLTGIITMLPVNVSMALLVTLAMTLCVSLTCTTAPSISVEGKNLWILKSLPLKAIDIFKGKILLNLVITGPILIISSTVLAAVFRLTIKEYLLAIAVGSSYCILIAVMGLIINLHFPKLEWSTQVTVVKQSASVMIALAAGFLSILLPMGIFALVKPSNSNLFLVLWFAAAAAADVGAYSYLKGRGTALFKAL